MDIDKLVNRQDAILAEIDALLKNGGASEALLAQPTALHEARIIRIKARITALEIQSTDDVARGNAELKALRGELADAEAKLEADRKVFARL